nr:ATP-sulfurylase PUA-like domain-containing protein [Tanacetum cinerariifolium]
GIDILKISCPSCNGNVESNTHIFFKCPLAKEVWKIIRRWCGDSTPFFNSNSHRVEWLASWHGSQSKKKRFLVINAATLWSIWRSQLQKKTQIVNIRVYHISEVEIFEEKKMPFEAVAHLGNDSIKYAITAFSNALDVVPMLLAENSALLKNQSELVSAKYILALRSTIITKKNVLQELRVLHPGLPYAEEAINDAGDWLIGGDLEVIQPIKYHDGFDVIDFPLKNCERSLKRGTLMQCLFSSLGIRMRRCDKTVLEDSFYTRVIVTRGENIKKCLDSTTTISRDAFAKIVYTKLFDCAINARPYAH